MSYISGLSAEAQKNLDLVAKAVKSSFENRYTQAAVLDLSAKESGFKPRKEGSYAGTPNYRIRDIFGNRVADLSEAQLTALKSNPKDFFEKVYGYKSGAPLGNTMPGDGYKFIGRGFNQITGRGNYTFYGKQIGVDLVNNPELLENPEIAAKALIAFLRIQSQIKGNKMAEYGARNLEDFKDLNSAIGAIYHINAGWGKSKQTIESDPTGGLKFMRTNGPEFLEYVGGEKKNSSVILLSALILLLLFFLWLFVFRK